MLYVKAKFYTHSLRPIERNSNETMKATQPWFTEGLRIGLGILFNGISFWVKLKTFFILHFRLRKL